MGMGGISIEIETRSNQSVSSVGVYRYADDASFCLTRIHYALDDGALHTIDLTHGALPESIVERLLDPKVEKIAWDAQAKRVCLTYYLRQQGSIEADAWLDPSGWDCVMIRSMAVGLPRDLRTCAEVLCIIDNDTKMDVTMYLYAAKMIRERLHALQLTENERDVYVLDQKINDRGVNIDARLVEAAIELYEAEERTNTSKLTALTCLRNPNSTKQFKEWLHKNGCPVPNLQRDTMEKLTAHQNTRIAEAVELRLSLANQSNSKYKTTLDTLGSDGRIRGLVQMYGAQRTGRWSGQIVQVQNIPRNMLEPTGLIREFIKSKDAETLELIYGNVSDTTKDVIRTAIIPKDGYTFTISDFSSIEARVLAWLADEEWAMEVFNRNEDIYKGTASRMYDVPAEDIDDALRSKGKIATLALGYQGAVGALARMGADMEEHEMQELVNTWRGANKNIVNFWYNIERAAKYVINNGGSVTVGRVTLSHEMGFLFITLPSGRKLAYPKPYADAGTITYKTYTNGEKEEHTYGGKLVENIVQAVARDVLAEALIRLDSAGFSVVMHVHDEVIVEHAERADIDDIMRERPLWAQDLPIDVESFVSDYYRK